MICLGPIRAAAREPGDNEKSRAGEKVLRQALDGGVNLIHSSYEYGTRWMMARVLKDHPKRSELHPVIKVVVPDRKDNDRFNAHNFRIRIDEYLRDLHAERAFLVDPTIPGPDNRICMIYHDLPAAVPDEDGRRSVLQSQNSDKNTLQWVTPPAWTDQATADLLALLDDHAHLERKAASNALELLHRWPSHSDDVLAQQWTLVLTGVARDEIEHLGAVTRLLAQRGGRISRMHRNSYASALRRLVRKGNRGELVDRLIVCALIELRSFERFEMLAISINDDLLTRLYQRLAISERGHHAVFLELAGRVTPAAEVADRWTEMLGAEAKIISTQPPGPRMHSGVS